MSDKENAFEYFSDEELEEKGLRPGEAIELVRALGANVSGYRTGASTN